MEHEHVEVRDLQALQRERNLILSLEILLVC